MSKASWENLRNLRNLRMNGWFGLSAVGGRLADGWRGSGRGQGLLEVHAHPPGANGGSGMLMVHLPNQEFPLKMNAVTRFTRGGS